jgi:hypothetical protein
MPGEVKMTDTEWYVAMGEAVKERGRAASMVENWQEKVKLAEARIYELSTQAPEQAPEQVPTEQV